MTATEALGVSLVLAVLVLAWWGKPAVTWVSGLITKDKKGRIVLVLSPAKKRKRRKRR